MKHGELIASKMERMQRGHRPRVLDVFAGCGGMTLGFVTAGCESIGGLEKNPDAARTFAYNFHREEQELHSRARDVQTTQPIPYLRELGHEWAPEAVDILVGGPPCPTFSRIGRAKLNYRQKELGDDSPRHVQRGLFNAESQGAGAGYQDQGAHLGDDRNQLYETFISFVSQLLPVAVVMENVPEFLSQAGVNHGESAARLLEYYGYRVGYTLLNSAAYGVPQWRERFFLFAIHEDADVAPADIIPVPTRNADTVLPHGVRANRRAALKLLKHEGRDHSGQDLLWVNDWWAPIPRVPGEAPGVVTCKDALGDLPRYDRHLRHSSGDADPTWREEKLEPYPGLPESSYARLMRSWKGFETSDGFPAHHHVTRRTTIASGRDRKIFEKMEPGDEFPQAMEIAWSNLEEERRARETSGRTLTPDKLRVIERQCVPPYARDKFPNKWWMLDPDRPSRTLTAHLGKDSYSHIHYDREQARMITIQEAARLQSIPDGFTFRCTLNPALTQIGNSVPPLVSLAIARSLLGALVSRSAGATRDAGLPK